MVGLKSIVAHFNSILQAWFISNYPERWGENFRIHGLATNAIRGGVQSKEVFPVIFEYDGSENAYVGMNDIKTFILYHKNLSFTAGNSRDGNYGDRTGDIKNSYEMQLVCFLKRTVIGLEGDEFALLLQSIFPGAYKTVDGMRIDFIFKNVILNNQQVFGNEYKNVPYSVRPEHALIAINYTIESTFRKNCFNLLS